MAGIRRSLSPDGRLLVLISGPIASGKTTAARTLAAFARHHDHRAASIDMDDLIEVVAGDDWSLVHHHDHVLATSLASAMVDWFFKSGLDLVAVAGSTLSNHEWDDLLSPLNPRPKPFHVLLRVSNEEAIRRAQNDPYRTRTKDAAFIARRASRVDWDLIRDHHVDLITDGLSAEEVGHMLARTIFE